MKYSLILDLQLVACCGASLVLVARLQTEILLSVIDGWMLLRLINVVAEDRKGTLPFLFSLAHLLLLCLLLLVLLLNAANDDGFDHMNTSNYNLLSNVRCMLLHLLLPFAMPRPVLGILNQESGRKVAVKILLLSLFEILLVLCFYHT